MLEPLAPWMVDQGVTSTAAAWSVLVKRVMGRRDLDAEQTRWAMDQIMAGATDVDRARIIALLAALHTKGETADEIDGFVAAMLEHARPLDLGPDAVDVVGTGGDGANTVNISTMAALVVAGAGVTVVKHGNRAASSTTGSADVLEELGIDLELEPAQVAQVARDVGITFCFARVFHPAMRHAGPIRSDIGAPTVFNFLGPLTNPAHPRAQAVGCGDERMLDVMAQVFARRQVSALVFRGDDGLDELTTTTTSRVHVVRDGQVTALTLDPTRLGLPRAVPGDLRGGERAHNARVLREVLDGRTGPVRDAVVLNAAAALVAYGPGEGDFEDLMAGAMQRAADSIDSGSAAATLARWVAASERVGAAGG